MSQKWVLWLIARLTSFMNPGCCGQGEGLKVVTALPSHWSNRKRTPCLQGNSLTSHNYKGLLLHSVYSLTYHGLVPFWLLGSETEVENDEKEVVQLRLLNKSDDEQMQKLFTLLRTSADVTDFYLHDIVFPANLRLVDVR